MKTKHVLFILSIILSSVCGIAQWNDQNSSITNDLNHVCFINSNEGWAVGRQGKIIHTINAGTSWSEQNSGTTKDLNKVFMVSSTIGYAVGDDGTFIKYNGSSWTTIDISFSQDMHGVYFVDANTGWISGDWGRIMMTTNGGTSWTNQVTNAQYSNLFYDLHMLSANEGWAVGTTGRVLKYNGTSWSNQTTPASGDLYSVSFSDSNNGFMTGKNSAVFHFNGSNWTTHNTSLPDNSFHVYSVTTLSNSLAYAATTPGFGGAGIILKYNGSTWTTDYEFTGIGTELFYGIHFPSTTFGCAVGVGGMVKTKGSGGPSEIKDVEQSTMNINVYPNPTDGMFTISFDLKSSENCQLEVIDAAGRTLHNVDPNTLVIGNNLVKIDGASFSGGIYFVKIFDGHNTVIERLIRQ